MKLKNTVTSLLLLTAVCRSGAAETVQAEKGILQWEPGIGVSAKPKFLVERLKSSDLGIRTPTHLYGVGMDDPDLGIANEGLQFYDLRKDPYQQNNLIGSDEQSDVAGELLQRLQEWDQATPRLKTHSYKPWQDVLWKSPGQRKARYGLRQ